MARYNLAQAKKLEYLGCKRPNEAMHAPYNLTQGAECVCAACAVGSLLPRDAIGVLL